MNLPLLFIGLIVLAILIRLVAGRLDGERVRDYIQGHGGRLLSSKWTPFGNGWAGENSDRIYEIRYLDGDGNEHSASCKTSLLTGVYFSEDHIIRHRNPPLAETPIEARLAELENENRRLREELKRAKGFDS